MFLVGLGVDSRAERMVNYLASKSNLDISLLTFQGFNHEGKTLLAKQVKVEGRELPLSKRPSSEELRKSLIQRSETHGIGTLYDDVRGMLKEYWLSSKQVPKKLGFTVRMIPPLDNKFRTFARVDPEEERVRLVFFQRAIDLCRNEFREAVGLIHYETWPQNRDPIKDKGNTEIQFLLTSEEWEAHKETLTEISQTVYESLYDASSEDGSDPE